MKIEFKKKREQGKENKNFLLAKYLNIGYYLVSPLLLGVLVGFIIDKKFNTKPIFILAFILIGTVSTFYNLIKIVKEAK